MIRYAEITLEARLVYGRGEQIVARGPHVARRSVFSGPQNHKNFHI